MNIKITDVPRFYLAVRYHPNIGWIVADSGTDMEKVKRVADSYGAVGRLLVAESSSDSMATTQSKWLDV